MSMSGFNHSTQLGTTVPGAMMQRESSTSDCTHMLSDSVAASVQPVAIPASLDFKVQYTLGEYVTFMWQHSARLIRRRRIVGLAAWWMTFKSTWHAALHFVMLRRSRHVYAFTIDPHGIVRATASGVTLVPWPDVSAIRRYSLGYMMVLQRGTLPIPYRCLDEAQQQTMDQFVMALRQARR
jgi:hypothetical protein